ALASSHTEPSRLRTQSPRVFAHRALASSTQSPRVFAHRALASSTQSPHVFAHREPSPPQSPPKHKPRASLSHTHRRALAPSQSPRAIAEPSSHRKPLPPSQRPPSHAEPSRQRRALDHRALA